jgi:signal peptidase I
MFFKKKSSAPVQERQWIADWAFNIVLLVWFTSTVAQPFVVPTASMESTIMTGDHLIVDKIPYSPPGAITKYFLPYQDVRRGDVVVFMSPTQVDQPDDPNPTLVKRLVAVGGDTVWMRGGLFYLNGMPQRQGFAASQNEKGDGGFSHPLFQWQKPFEVRGSSAGDPPAQPTLDDWGPLVVPKDMLFMLGDNRYDSKDGRYWGFVPRENVRGRPVFVYYSYRADESDKPLPFITDIRWGRLGTIIR